MKVLILMITTALSLSSFAQSIQHRITLLDRYEAFIADSGSDDGKLKLKDALADEDKPKLKSMYYETLHKIIRPNHAEEILTDGHAELVTLVRVLEREQNLKSGSMIRNEDIKTLLDTYLNRLLIKYNLIGSYEYRVDLIDTINGVIESNRSDRRENGSIGGKLSYLLNHRTAVYKDLIRAKINEIKRDNFKIDDAFGSLERKNIKIDNSLRNNIKDLRDTIIKQNIGSQVEAV